MVGTCTWSQGYVKWRSKSRWAGRWRKWSKDVWAHPTDSAYHLGYHGNANIILNGFSSWSPHACTCTWRQGYVGKTGWGQGHEAGPEMTKATEWLLDNVSNSAYRLGHQHLAVKCLVDNGCHVHVMPRLCNVKVKVTALGWEMKKVMEGRLDHTSHSEYPLGYHNNQDWPKTNNWEFERIEKYASMGNLGFMPFKIPSPLREIVVVESKN